MSIPVNEETRRMAATGWPAKLGTMPAVVKLHGSDIARLHPGSYVRVKEGFPSFSGERWKRVLVRSVDPDTLYFQADR